VGEAAEEGNLTPAVAHAYCLGVMVPQYRFMGVRTGRELRTLVTVLDPLAQKGHPEAADLVARRIKALERSIVDGRCLRAQYLELIPPKGATLLEKDEDIMIAREHDLDQRLKFAKPWLNLVWYPAKGNKDGKKGEKDKWEGKGQGKFGRGRGRGDQAWIQENAPAAEE
jgi:hypothetical protein